MERVLQTSSEPRAGRVMYVNTTSVSVRQLRGQLKYLREAGFDVIVASSPGEELDNAHLIEGVQTVSVPIAREISLPRDLLSLWRLWCMMRRLRPLITNVSTPKAGLLGGLAAWLNGVPCRVYTLRGLRCETAAGLKRWILLFCEWVACRCAHQVICVSENLRQKAVSLGVVDPEIVKVLGSGSSNGVDSSRFAPSPEHLREAEELRRRLGIPSGQPIVGFVGRLTRDKGVIELFRAYCRVRKPLPNLRLLLLGKFEQEDPLPAKIRQAIESDAHILRLGFVTDVSPYYHLMDVVALPSHREGFPNAVLEAHAAGKPIVASRATGVIDAVINGVTGILVRVGDAEALASGLELLLRDKALNAAMGNAGRERVCHEFRQERVWAALAQEYVKLLETQGLPLPEAHVRRPVPAPRRGPAIVQS